MSLDRRIEQLRAELQRVEGEIFTVRSTPELRAKRDRLEKLIRKLGEKTGSLFR